MVEAMEKLDIRKGLVITMDQEDTSTIQGKNIEIVPAYKWATKENGESNRERDDRKKL